MTTLGQQLVTRRRFAPSTVVDGREHLGAPTDVECWATVEPVSRRRLVQSDLGDDVKEAIELTCEQVDWRAGDPVSGAAPDRLYRGLLTPTRVVVTFTGSEPGTVLLGTEVATTSGVVLELDDAVELVEVDDDLYAGSGWATARVNGAVNVLAGTVTAVDLVGVEVENALAGVPGTEPADVYEVHQASFVGGTPDDEQRGWVALCVRRDKV